MKYKWGSGEDERGQFNVGIWLSLYSPFVDGSVVTPSDDFTGREFSAVRNDRNTEFRFSRKRRLVSSQQA